MQHLIHSAKQLKPRDLTPAQQKAKAKVIDKQWPLVKYWTLAPDEHPTQSDSSNVAERDSSVIRRATSGLSVADLRWLPDQLMATWTSLSIERRISMCLRMDGTKQRASGRHRARRGRSVGLSAHARRSHRQLTLRRRHTRSSVHKAACSLLLLFEKQHACHAMWRKF